MLTLTFQGRVNRITYLVAGLGVGILFAILDSIVTWNISLNSIEFRDTQLLLLLVLHVTEVVVFVPLMFRRFHDLNCSAWIGLAAILVAVVLNNVLPEMLQNFPAFIVSIATIVLKGSPGANNYGGEPMDMEFEIFSWR